MKPHELKNMKANRRMQNYRRAVADAVQRQQKEDDFWRDEADDSEDLPEFLMTRGRLTRVLLSLRDDCASMYAQVSKLQKRQRYLTAAAYIGSVVLFVVLYAVSLYKITIH
jgi:hypothetical protein